MQRGFNHHSGFTLVELLLAMSIFAVLGSLAVPFYSSQVEKMRVKQAMADIRKIEAQVQRFYTDNFRYPSLLSELTSIPTKDPWGQNYQYLNIADDSPPIGQLRKDHNLVPINSDYDLYSTGIDTSSAKPLTSALSRDDVVRANNGGYVGLAAEY